MCPIYIYTPERSSGNQPRGSFESEALLVKRDYTRDGRGLVKLTFLRLP